ncbi:hypothetical protein HN51_020841 [Arachis hypogaea]|uniref:uncharacterized protein isoform X1 n=1 Tax=Arachis hypogaea TaxID=3818 RepID=UPI000DECEB7C|nr:uncharacterized protein LOC112730242 [Arachis hypogaea]
MAPVGKPKKTVKETSTVHRPTSKASVGAKRGRDDGDGKPKKTVKETSTVHRPTSKASLGAKSGRDDGDGKQKKTVKETSIVHLPPDEELTTEQINEYYRQFFGSQGFIVPDYGGRLCGGVGPYSMTDKYRQKLVKDMIQKSLRIYNRKNKVNFEFDKLVRVNAGAVAGLMFYITFNARSGDDAPQTFYSKVWKSFNGYIKVQFCVIGNAQEVGTSQDAGTSQESGITQA